MTNDIRLLMCSNENRCNDKPRGVTYGRGSQPPTTTNGNITMLYGKYM